MIVVEGPDGAGKTNLVTRLAEDLKLDLIPRAVNSNAEDVVDVCQWIEESLDLGFGRFIYDRHQLFSAPIYAPTMRRTMPGKWQNSLWVHQVWQRFWKLNPVVIICLPPFEVVKANCLADETSKIAHKDIEVYYWQYYTWAYMHLEKRWTWDYTAINAKEFYGYMVQEISRHLFYGGDHGRPR